MAFWDIVGRLVTARELERAIMFVRRCPKLLYRPLTPAQTAELVAELEAVASQVKGATGQ